MPAAATACAAGRPARSVRGRCPIRTTLSRYRRAMSSWRPTSNCAFRSGVWCTARLSSIWAISGISGGILRSTPTTPSSFSTSFISSWDSTPDWVCRAPARLGRAAPQSQQSGGRTVDPQPPLEEYRAQLRRRISLLTRLRDDKPRRSAAAGVSYAGGCAYCRICIVRHAPPRHAPPGMLRRMRIAGRVPPDAGPCQFCALYCEGDMPVLRLK